MPPQSSARNRHCEDFSLARPTPALAATQVSADSAASPDLVRELAQQTAVVPTSADCPARNSAVSSRYLPTKNSPARPTVCQNPSMTEYHSQYYAYQLTKRLASDNSEKLSQSLLNATVDLNPHQVEAALFAFRSPLSRGAILADEVGLGKTIEAGLIISQLWAERKRRILCIVLANLRKQWNRELLEKFFIESVILEAKNFRAFKKSQSRNPFDQSGTVVICSHQFAYSRVKEMEQVPWDVVIIDEAHRLRNVYKKSSKIARVLRDAVVSRPKVLLTATPLQNSLMELYGLVSFVDPHLFGDEESFRSQFATRPGAATDGQLQTLKQRIKPICRRTLRRQVTEYVRYTDRISFTQDFTPTDAEVRLYDAVSTYLQKDALFALPASQRQLITLVLRKILASSSFAITATLGTMIDRLERQQAEVQSALDEGVTALLGDDLETVDDLEEEWVEDGDEASDGETDPASQMRTLTGIQAEIRELRHYKTLAESIKHNAKGEALLQALQVGFTKADDLGSPKKVLLFTESRRTQTYLKELLEANGYAGQIVTFNGTNTDSESKRIYADWLARHTDEDCVTGSPTADMRSALVEQFKDYSSVMIATESAAEGVNLQFCNVVVNYDLPWNPQRIEQRIGRCHRYGQQHDVVVINFINRKNEADQRVFQLLSQKFKLFDGVFGASDDVLGVLESGVDFEKRILEIYQRCRTPDAINAAFDALQRELEEQIAAGMADARTKLLEHFDEDVHRTLRFRFAETEKQIDRFQSWLWRVTKLELADSAEFDDGQYSFILNRYPEGLAVEKVPLGRYRLVTDRQHSTDHQFRFGHPLVTALIERAKLRSLPPAEVTFDYGGYRAKVSLIEQLAGQSGWLRASLLSITALETEEHLVLSGMTDGGRSLDSDTLTRLFDIYGTAHRQTTVPTPVAEKLDAEFRCARDALIEEGRSRNLEFFSQEIDKLSLWADDLKSSLETELKELGQQLKELNKESKRAATLEQKLAFQSRIRELDRKQKEKRKRLFEAHDEIDARRDELISEAEQRLQQAITSRELFTLRWSIV